MNLKRDSKLRTKYTCLVSILLVWLVVNLGLFGNCTLNGSNNSCEIEAYMVIEKWSLLPIQKIVFSTNKLTLKISLRNKSNQTLQIAIEPTLPVGVRIVKQPAVNVSVGPNEIVDVIYLVMVESPGNYRLLGDRVICWNLKHELVDILTTNPVDIKIQWHEIPPFSIMGFAIPFTLALLGPSVTIILLILRRARVHKFYPIRRICAIIVLTGTILFVSASAYAYYVIYLAN